MLSRRPIGDPAGNVVVAPPGDLDSSTAATLCTSLHEALAQQPETIVLDLHWVTSLDRAAFGRLVSALREVA